MNFKKLLKNPFKRKNINEPPKAWGKHKPVKVDRKQRGDIQIPFLKTFNRGVAFAMLIVNLLISQVTLMSSPSQPLFWFFLLNAYVDARYLWKTRG